MDLRNLRYFAAIADAGGFSAATEIVHRSQPALSRAISDLEKDLGFALFAREGRRVALTPEGRSFLEQARPVIEGAGALEERARLFAAGRTFVLRVGAAPSTIERVLPPVLAAFQVKRPDVEVTLASHGGSALLAALERGELDAVLTRMTSSDVLESRQLFPSCLVAVVPARHRLASRKSLDVRDLADERVLVAPREFTSRMRFDEACRAIGIRPRIVFENHDHNALVALAATGFGIALVPSSVLLRGEVRPFPLLSGGAPMGAWFGLVTRRNARGPHIRDFLNVAAGQLKDSYPGKELQLPKLKRKISSP
jgi:DNA-binding transcriptional LysR family regulator